MKSTTHAAIFEFNYGDPELDENNNPIPGSEVVYALFLVYWGPAEDLWGNPGMAWIRDAEELIDEFYTEEEAAEAARSAGLRLVKDARWEEDYDNHP